MSVFRLLITALALVALGQAVHAQSDPVAYSKQLRYAKRYDEAASALRPVLAANSKHYLANYNMGLIEEARAQLLTGEAKRLKLVSAATWMERALAVNAEQSPREYTIFSTTGYVYLQLKDIKNADRVLMQGLQFANLLSPPSREKLYNNLGYLHTLKGERQSAIRYYELAKGAPGAEANAKRLGTVK